MVNGNIIQNILVNTELLYQILKVNRNIRHCILKIKIKILIRFHKKVLIFM